MSEGESSCQVSLPGGCDYDHPTDRRLTRSVLFLDIWGESPLPLKVGALKPMFFCWYDRSGAANTAAEMSFPVSP
jgi:hypothetical protein